MMMYDFKCPACGNTFEDITDGTCPPCPECGCADTQIVPSAPWLKTNPMPFKIQPPRPQAPKLKFRGNGGCPGSCPSAGSGGCGKA